jgi:hypothetical protein
MAKNWEVMTTEERLSWLRQNIESLQGQLRAYFIEMDQGQKGLNDRIVKLEQVLKP